MTRRLSRFAVALLAALLCGPAAAQVFKWTDAAGNTHYGDKPPEGAKKQEIKITAKSYDGPPQIEDWAAIIRSRSYGDAKGTGSAALTMYSATWCGPCRRAKAYLAQQNIAYRDVDIDASEENQKEFKAQGGGGVPLFVASGKRMRGFSPAALDRLLAAQKR